MSGFEGKREVLKAVANVKFPASVRRGLPNETTGELQPLSPNEKIEQLESYLIETAEARQEAHLAKLVVQEVLDGLQTDWQNLEGWEIALPDGKKRTQADVTEAKRRTSPRLFEQIQEGKRLIDRLSEQIRRLEIDDKVASRAYTLITGS